MQNQRAHDAFARIEQALQRIEAATGESRPSSGQSDELERLRAAHQLLRSRVQGAIGEIDRMLVPDAEVAG